ncbi:unnamed protein product [Periconia digitata]|uniref:Uncharacterized protein n=1 Tax=Periconia digitata TaxID=1303443 RepID=A0A9W4UIZ6_9PLEO|nr:unnamed protein product [Periconia digitata]
MVLVAQGPPCGWISCARGPHYPRSNAACRYLSCVHHPPSLAFPLMGYPLLSSANFRSFAGLTDPIRFGVHQLRSSLAVCSDSDCPLPALGVQRVESLAWCVSTADVAAETHLTPSNHNRACLLPVSSSSSTTTTTPLLLPSCPPSNIPFFYSFSSSVVD